MDSVADRKIEIHTKMIQAEGRKVMERWIGATDGRSWMKGCCRWGTCPGSRFRFVVFLKKSGFTLEDDVGGDLDRYHFQKMRDTIISIKIRAGPRNIKVSSLLILS